jgi:outer membrane protein insertion porin family
MRSILLVLTALAAVPAPTYAQAPAPASAPAANPTTVCGLPIPQPAKLPPSGSGPVVYQIAPCFEKQGGASVIDPQTYVYYIQVRPSQPSQDKWTPYDEKTEQLLLGDFKRLWATNFLDDLSIEVQDYRFSNGVIGKLIIYNMEERQRVKIVDYAGTMKVDQTKIEEQLKEKGITIRLDSFIDPGLIRRVTSVVREHYAEKGYQFADVKPEIKEVAGGPKTVHLTFHITEGPKVKIRDVEFVGNSKVSDRALNRKMKENKGRGWLSFFTGGGTYKEAKFEEDADNVISYYRDKGYITARVGQPELKVLEDSEDGKTRWVEMRVPVTEGNRYRIGDFTFEGNKVVRSEALRSLFKVKAGEIYSEKAIRKGLDKAREIYGSIGYYEFVGAPDLKPRDMPAADGNAGGDGNAGPPAPPSDGNGNGAQQAEGKSQPPTVDVTMRMIEGQQYFINRITFVGNTTTRDAVIRRELRLVEAGVFNTEALKQSVRRLNQLGYFKPLEGAEAISVEKTPNAEAKVDIQLKLEEQNRNQLTFGAGVSQYEGFFGQLSFQTANFLGRGETFTVSAQQGGRAKNYQLAFTEPYLFDRPMTGGVDLFIREIRYINQFTQSSVGGNTVFGFQVADFARMFMTYSYEAVKVEDLNPLYLDPNLLNRNPFLRDSLLIGLGQRRTISKITPSYVYNTVDHPIFPTTGTRYTATFDLAGLGGNTQFYNPRAEAVWYKALNRRTSLGFRVQAEYIAPYGQTIQELPIFEKLFLGGEYSIRGFDLRTVGPRDASTGLVVGGNKSLLGNAEYLINIAGPVRLVLFADAGQVRDRGENFVWKETLTAERTLNALGPGPDDALNQIFLNPFRTTLATETVALREAYAFKTSVGAEIRFFMPVLNVPFRLIFAMNPSRAGVLDNNLEQEKKYKFRFAVGSTF